MTKWFDNKSVYLASNFVGIGISDTVQRYDKKDKQFVEVERPEVVKLYNKGMGGVDLLDQMIQYYRIFIKSKKWTLRVVMHFFDMAVVASWLEYRADNEKNGVPLKNQLDLLAFKKIIGNTLLTISPSAINRNKRGRPSRGPESPLQDSTPHENVDCVQFAKTTKRFKYFAQPPTDVRLDGIRHLPKFDQSQNAMRCKFEGCNQKTFIYCEKCKAHLCIRRKSDCFYNYHLK